MSKAEFFRAAHECGIELATYAARIAGVDKCMVALWASDWGR